MVDPTPYYADLLSPVSTLSIATPFSNLTKTEKLYSHHLSQACWSGARIILGQTSPNGEQLFDFLISIFSEKGEKNKLTDLEQLKKKSQAKEEDFEAVLQYTAQVLSNLGNIKSFGATKFIPRCTPSAFFSIVSSSSNSSTAIPQFHALEQEIFSLDPEGLLSIGKPIDGHQSGYYWGSEKVTDAEVDEVQRLCDENGVSTLNTRLSKHSSSALTLHIASASTTIPLNFPTTLDSPTLGFTLTLEAGDFSSSLEKASSALLSAAKYAENSNREAMLKDYVKSFSGGDMEDHKDGSRKWVKDVGPVVESYIGFIESYQDPYGGRAEWEGFVAIVNKEQSKKFEQLVNIAEEVLPTLPWGKHFEVDKFQRPDFTALEILTFATGGIPAGINIPNYHDVREHDGFKNVSLSNILSAKAATEISTFIAPEEIEKFDLWSDKAFEVQVANHELLGHGSGKLSQQAADGTFNFDTKLVNPLTGKAVESWYKPGETYGSKIGPVSSSMEECRAEAVALYLCHNRDILSIFKFNTDAEAEDLQYYTYLVMARAGIRALEWYDPKTSKHGQAHMEARLGITNWLIDHGIVKVEEIRDEQGKLTDAYMRVDRKAVLEKGKEVMGKLLVEIMVRKSVGDGAGATAFYKKLTTPNSHWIKELRPLVLAKKLPRKCFVQPTTSIVDGEVVLREYPTTVQGVIESFVVRGV